MAVVTTLRKFAPGHFAFMREVMQGIDLRASWDGYLGTTSGYLTTERDARLAAMKGFGGKIR